MSNEKRTKQFEDGRQKIDVDTNTRSQKADTPAKNKRNSSILTPVFLLFICIPIAFIVYFWKFYDPSSVGEQAKIDDNQVVEVAKNSPINNGSAPVVEQDDDKEELSEEEKVAAALAAQEAAEKAAKAEAERVAQKVAEEKAAAEAAEAERRRAEAAAEEERRKAEEEEARRQAAIAAEEARKQAEREAARRAAEQAKQQEQQKQQTVRHHTVQPGETIYRISVNYYGSGDAVERIKAANGLGSNEISVGQTLILP